MALTGRSNGLSVSLIRGVVGVWGRGVDGPWLDLEGVVGARDRG
jgi:hypothetical protein